MKWKPHIPNAHSEPRDLHDEVVSDMLWSASGLLDWFRSGYAPSAAEGELQRALADLSRIISEDERLNRLVDELPKALGGGVLLQAAFNRLFQVPPQPVAVPLPPENGWPKITEREKQVLVAMSEGLRKQEIAVRLSISERTVKSHFNHIYEKLGVDNPAEAVTKAAVLGYLSASVDGFITHDRSSLSMNALANTLIAHEHWRTQTERPTDVQRLAALGLLLFLLAAMPPGLNLQQSSPPACGFVLEYNASGQLIRKFGAGAKLARPRATSSLRTATPIRTRSTRLASWS
jgi:DNA-binding CsgD family transcriptional regulator